MIRKVTFYWILVTLMLVDAWLLSKPNLLGKIGLIIYKYHYLRTFPRTLMTVWIVVSISILIVWAISYLKKLEKLSKVMATAILGIFFVASIAMMTKIYIDFTAWSYSHSGLKFRIGAYLLPVILMVVFASGLIQIQWRGRRSHESAVNVETISEEGEVPVAVSHDTSQP